MLKFPKYLVELDREKQFVERLPATPLWVARLRNPFCLALVEISFEKVSLNFWPPVVDGDRARLANRLAFVLGHEYDLYRDELPAPALLPEIVEPPRYLNMVRANSDSEFVLEAHAPRLWRISVDVRDNTTGATWWRGFGVEPEFPDDTRAVAEFLQI
jgi:hypothetical protein